MKKLTLIIIALIATNMAFSQKWEIGLFGGAANYMGDLSEESIVMSETRPAVGGLVRYYPSPFFSLRLGLTYGTISGSDENFNNSRNLSFKSDIFEFAVLPEFNILGFRDHRNFTPYIFAGVAAFRFNPRTLYNGEWVALQPLGTEGQGTSAYPERQRYNLTQISIPFGAGIKIGFGDGLNIGLDAGLRKTFTDYLDDVSTTYVNRTLLTFENGVLAAELSNRSGVEFTDQDMRGNPATQDWYMFGGVTITYTIGASSGKKDRCPVF